MQNPDRFAVCGSGTAGFGESVQRRVRSSASIAISFPFFTLHKFRTGIIVKSIQFFLSQKFKSRTSIKNLIKYIVARYIEDYASINYSN